MATDWAESTVLTDEGEGGGEDEEHAVAVHGEGDGEVHGQTAPHEELVDCGPVVGVQTQLGHTDTDRRHMTPRFQSTPGV